MKKLEQTSEKVIIEFTVDEYAKLSEIVSTVNQQYENLDPVILNMTEEEVRTYLYSIDKMDGLSK